MAAEPIILEILQEWSRARQLHPNKGVPELRQRLGSDVDDHLDKAEAYRDANASTPTWETILLEEVHEALAAPDAVSRRAELVQVAAVCVRWIEEALT